MDKIELYVSRYGGNDNNDGLTKSTPLRTIMAAVAKLPQTYPETRRIFIAPGEYDEIVLIRNFYGAEVVLTANWGQSEKPVIRAINFERCDRVKGSHLQLSHQGSLGIAFQRCAYAFADDIVILSNQQGILASECTQARVNNCRISNGSAVGIEVSNTTAWVTATEIKDSAVGIMATDSTVYVKGNTITSPEKYRLERSQIIEQ